MPRQREMRGLGTKASEIGLASDRRLIRSLSEISRAINSRIKLEKVFHVIAREVAKMVPCQRISIALLDDSGKNLEVFELSPKTTGNERKKMFWPVEDSRAGQAVKRGRLIMKTRLDQNLQYAEDHYLTGRGIRSVLNLPLIHRGEAIGTLNLGRKSSGGFNREETALLKQISCQISLSVNHARLCHKAPSVQNSSEEKYRTLFTDASDAIFLSDPQTGQIIEANRQAELLTGLTLQEMRQLAAQDFVTSREGYGFLEFSKDLVRGGKSGGSDFVTRRKDGKTRTTEISASIIGYGGQKVVQSIVRDVTERRAAEAEKARLLEKIKESYEELRRTETQLVHSEKMASLGQLVAGVAHELNNPIGFLASNLEHLHGFLEKLKEMIWFYDRLLQDDVKKRLASFRKKEVLELEFTLQTMERLLDSCRRGALRTKEIVESLRTFSRTDETSVKEADIHENLEVTLSLLGNQIRDRIIVHRDYGEVPRVECNIGQLNQVFMNLISNACQAISGQGDVWITTRVEDETLLIVIRDNGAGIPSARISRIFDPFFSTKDPGAGTGLGLSIAFGVVRSHGGSIDVESCLGKGSTFTVRIPIRRQLVWETDFSS